MSSKYQALLRAKRDIASAEAEDQTSKFAHHLIKCLDIGSNWLQIETIKNLKYFTEFNFVQKALMEKYAKTDSDEVKTAIKELHDGILDTSEMDSLIEESLQNVNMDQNVHKQASKSYQLDRTELSFRKNK